MRSTDPCSMTLFRWLAWTTCSKKEPLSSETARPRKRFRGPFYWFVTPNPVISPGRPDSRYRSVLPARIQVMARALRADDILPLVDSLTPQERQRLLRLI